MRVFPTFSGRSRALELSEFWGPDYAKTHLRAIKNSKIFPGVVSRPHGMGGTESEKKEREGRGWKGREKGWTKEK